jgi:hypothetical protein
MLIVLVADRMKGSAAGGNIRCDRCRGGLRRRANTHGFVSTDSRSVDFCRQGGTAARSLRVLRAAYRVGRFGQSALFLRLARHALAGGIHFFSAHGSLVEVRAAKKKIFFFFPLCFVTPP